MQHENPLSSLHKSLGVGTVQERSPPPPRTPYLVGSQGLESLHRVMGR
jgi:hypothetical protein